MLKRYLPSSLWPVLVAAVLALSVPAHAQTRIALVIGNSAYQKVVNLANPAHDAQDVSASLKRLGFTVNTVIDADFDGFRRALRDFARMAPKADMAVFYFAGHGVEIDGGNWLLPTDAEIKSDIDASTEAIGLRSAMEAVAAAKTLGLVILDACRNNPFTSVRRTAFTRSVQILGLAPVEPVDNVLVAYAARDGTVAADGAGRNSPYAAALLKHIETPGLEVDFLFRNVRDDVMAATNNEQQPFVYGSLSSNEIYFKPPTVGPAVVDATPPPDASEIAWSFLRATNDVSTLARFVDRFPESAHISNARVRIASLATAAVSGATDVPPPPPTHLVAFVDTEFEQAEKAVARRFVRDTPAVEQAWDVIKETKDHTVIRHFVDRFPSKERRVVADTRLAALGQKPITARTVAPPALDVDEAVLTRAAVDPDVLECFQRNDQTADPCQRAFQRFPDIGRFIVDTRFVLSICQAMGNPSGCVPTVKTTWNFPGVNPGGGTAGGNSGATAGGSTGGGIGGGVGTGTSSVSGVGAGSGTGSPSGPGAGAPIPADKADVRIHADRAAMDRRAHTQPMVAKGLKGIAAISGSNGGNSNQPHHYGNGLGKLHTDALKLQQGVNASTGNVKTTGIKVTGVATIGPKTAITAPAVTTPNVNVKVNPNVRVNPNVKVNVTVRVPNVRVPIH
jgi:Caspase domain